MLKVFIPFLQEEISVFLDDSSDLTKFFGVVSDCPNESYGAQPEFGGVLSRFDVDMRWLVVFTAEKEETMSPDFQNRWYRFVLSFLYNLLKDRAAV